MPRFDVAALIRCVRERPPVWDKRKKEHKNRNVLEKCWEEISVQMRNDVGLKKTVWSDEGYRDWKNLARSLERHSTSKEHIQNDIGIKQLSKQAFSILEQLNEIAESSKKEYNAEVAKNREVFKLLIDLTGLLCKQELPYLGYDESNNSFNQIFFKEIFNVILANKEEAKSHWEKLESITGLSETIQIDIINCIAEEVKYAIRDTIKGAPFFSIQVDEITAWNEHAKCSIICRCVDKNGLIKEHFIGFCDRPIKRIKSEGQIKTEVGVCQQIMEVLEPFDYPQKLVAQAFDGASVLSHELNEIQAEIRSYAPQALLLPGLAHHLNFTLQQSCRNIAAVNIFFSTLQGIPAFFHNSTKRTTVLDRIVGKQIPTTCEVRWNSNTHIVVIISNERVKFIEVFQELMNTHDNSAETIRQAEAFKNKLSEFDFVFYLLVFQDIFLKTGMINGTLQKKLIDVMECLDHISACQTAIQDMRNEDTFKKYFEETRATIGRSPETNSSMSCNYRDNFYEIIDNVSTQIKTRFSNIASLKFLQLGNSVQFSNFHYKFPEETLNTLISTYGTFFDRHLLRNELMAVYADENKHLFHNTDVETILINIVGNDLCVTLPEAYKLFSLIATIPATMASARSFSCLNRLKTSLRNTMGQERLTNIMLLSTENELLVDISKQPSWHENIINRFAAEKEAILRKKWKYLRDQFAVEIAKVPPPPSPPLGVEADDYYGEISRWQYYGPLMFLKDVVKPRSIQGNLSKIAGNSFPIEVLVKEEFMEEISESEVQNHHLHSEGESEASGDELVIGGEFKESSSSTNMDEKIQERGKRRRVDEFNEDSLGNNGRLKGEHPSERAVSTKGTTDDDDYDLLFFKSLLPHVRKIPDLKKLSFRNRVQEIVELFAYPQQ